MYTAFVTDCKSTLSSLWEQVQAIHAKQERNNTTFKEDYADSANAKLEADKKDACAAARERIAAIMDKATEDAARLDEITPLDVEPSEKNYQRVMELLSGRFDLSVENLNHLISEYIRDDRALLNAVSVYCQVRGMRLVRATTESRRAAIKSIRESALSVVSRIEGTSYKNGNRDLSAGLSVSNFCQDGDFAAETYAKLGQKFSGELIPARVEPEDGGFDFSFRGVRDADKKAG